MKRPPLADVISQNSARMLALSGVVGIGEGADAAGPFVGVFLVDDDPALAAGIPDSLAGYPVRITVTGRLASGSGAPLPARPVVDPDTGGY